ncbi:tetratricopeptide repeat protein [Streptomyces buecherae]|uniref:tetratricopeptide repeat protein n=1 Tax=Streptomyces buecherae TaxID=2763006 RepID=UPI00379E5898
MDSLTVHALSPPSTSVPGSWSIEIPIGRLDDAFTGREQLLRELNHALEDGQHSHRNQVLCGLGGCGKTTVAVAASQTAARRGADVWWVSAATTAELHEGMRQVALRLGASEAEVGRAWEGRDSATDLLWRLLQRHPQRWLLVVDNADDLTFLAAEHADFADGTGWLRPVSSAVGRVLVTSRNRNPRHWGHWWQSHTVDPLPLADAAEVLRRVAGPAAGPAADAKVLADRLGRLPLALRLAGAHLALAAGAPWQDTAATYGEYLARLDSGDLRDLVTSTETPSHQGVNDLPEYRARQVIGRTWELSLDYLASRGMPEARRLLRLLSFFAQAPIPCALLRPAVIGDAAGLLPGCDGPRLWWLLRALADLHLVDLPALGPGRGADPSWRGDPSARTGEFTETDSEAYLSDAVRLHPLVRAVTRVQGDAVTEENTYLGVIAKLLATASLAETTISPEEPGRWPLWQSLTPHALDLVHIADTRQETSQQVARAAVFTAVAVGRALRARGLYGRAEDVFVVALRVGCRILGDRHEASLAAHHEAAAIHLARGRLGEAETAYLTMTSHRCATLGADHPDTLISRHMLAYVWHLGGQLSKAEKEYRSILEVRTRILGERDAFTLATRYRVAKVLRDQGRPVEARTEMQAVVVLRSEVLGPEHPRTLNARRELARICHRQGYLDEAEGEYEAVYALHQRVLGDDHRHTLVSRSSRARLWQDRGRLAEAAAEYRDVLRRQEALLGEDHPYTRVTRGYLTQATREMDGMEG